MKDDRGNQNEYVDVRECEGQKKNHHKSSFILKTYVVE